MQNIILDNLNDTDNTSLASHTPNIAPRGAWTTTASNSFKIVGNILQADRNTDGDLGIIDSGVCDFTLNCTAISKQNTSANLAYAGLVFRYQDSSNFWYCFADTQNDRVRIYKVVAGVHSVMLNWPLTLGTTASMVIGIKCKGATVTLFIDGVEAMCVVDEQFMTATIVGVRNGKVGDGSVVPQWDGFNIIPFDGLDLNWPLFTEYAGNPIVALGAGGAWDDADCNNPNVVYDPVEKKFMVFWSGYSGTGANQGLGVARATSLLGPYTKDSNNPVFPVTYIQNGGHIYFKGKHFYYYGAVNSLNIGLAVGNDVDHFVDWGIVLNPNTANFWEVTRVFDAFARVRQDGETVELWYSSRDDADGINSLCFATSTDGINFTKSPLNPILRLANIRGEPSVFVPDGKEGKEMLVSYDFGGENNHYRAINQMLTIDGGDTWHYRAGALTGGDQSWKSNQVFDSFTYPVIVNGLMYFYHSGGDVSGGALNLNAQIGVATAPFPFTSLDAQFNKKIPFATKLKEGF
jgi:hypothetical protein